MKHIKGGLLSGDFLENTMTFEIEGDFRLQAGNYIIVKEEEYKEPEMYEALKKLCHIDDKYCKCPACKVAKPILKEIEKLSNGTINPS